MEFSELDEVIFGNRPVGRPIKDQILSLEVVRELELEDCEAIESGANLNPLPRVGTGIAKLKNSHHQIAQYLAQGLPGTEISLLTGYTPTYISSLQKGQDFQELLTHYSSERKRVFDTTLERMKSLGIATLERLQELIENESEAWTKRELMEMVKLMLVDPMTAKAGPGHSPIGAGASGVTVNVKFVAGRDAETASGPVIEANAIPSWEP